MTDSVPINTHKLIIISPTFGRGVEGTMSRVDFFYFLSSFFFALFIIINILMSHAIQLLMSQHTYTKVIPAILQHLLRLHQLDCSY